MPEPIEIPGNISEEHRSACLAFVRKTAILHMLSVFVIIGVAFIPQPRTPIAWTALAIFIALLILSMVRGIEKGRRLDLLISVTLMPILLVPMGMAVRELWMNNVPIWALGVGLVFSLLYTLLSGRDHSFVGQFVLSLIASSLTIAFVEHKIQVGISRSVLSILSNGGFLFYHVYDSAALLTRRRKGDELAAVVDLYRDFLNGLTYSVRVWRHWQKHKIWSLPR
jgi:hypothetical protein